MKRFVLALISGVALTTMAAVGAIWLLVPDAGGPAQAAPETPSLGAQIRPSEQVGFSGADFNPRDAVDVISSRLGESADAEQVRRALTSGASTSYHSYGHWTVRLGEASWTAHGVGSRYAEPDNDAARSIESRAGLSPAAAAPVNRRRLDD